MVFKRSLAREPPTQTVADIAIPSAGEKAIFPIGPGPVGVNYMYSIWAR